jgi:hypothetical protein
VVDQGVGGTAGVGADQDRLVARGGGELGQREVDHLEVVAGGVEPALPGRRIPASASPVPSPRARVVAVPRRLATTGPPRQRPGQAEPVGQLAQQPHPGMPGDAVTVGGDLKAWTRPGSLHPHGALLER